VHEEGSPARRKQSFESGVPVLGICYGSMAMAASSAARSRVGIIAVSAAADVRVKAASCLFDFHLGPGRRHPVG